MVEIDGWGFLNLGVTKLQRIVQNWVVSRLGSDAMNPIERGRRNFEENTELGQAVGVTRQEAHKIVDHVYDKPIGNVDQELGGAFMTLLGCATANNLGLLGCLHAELDRVHDLPMEKFQKRQAQNVVDGIGE